MQLDDGAGEAQTERETAATRGRATCEESLDFRRRRVATSKLDVDAYTLLGSRRSGRSNANGVAFRICRGRAYRMTDDESDRACCIHRINRHSWQSLGHFDDDFLMRVCCKLASSTHSFGCELCNFDRAWKQRELSGFDTCRIQDGLDEPEQLATSIFDERQTLALTRRQLFASHELGKTKDRVERTFEIVTDTGEEQSTHALRCFLCIESTLLSAGEDAKTFGQHFDGATEIRHEAEPCRTSDLCSAT